MATAWRLAKSLETLRSQVNAAYPNRSKASDGTIGDAAHSQTASDHNPNRNGVVCALDLTHDPARGFDAHALAEHLRKNRHPNLRYVISNARIAGWWTNWEWAASAGHFNHIHISVGNHGVGDGQSSSNYDSTQAWSINSKGVDVIEDNQRHYDLINQTWRDSTGRALTRAEFRTAFVGRDKLEGLTVVHTSPETPKWRNWALLGQKSQTEIAKLQDSLKQANAALAACQSSPMTDETRKQLEDAQKAADKALKRVEKLELEKQEGARVGNAFVQWLGELLNNLLKRG